MSYLCPRAVASRETTLDHLLFPFWPVNCANERRLTPRLGNLTEPQRLPKYQRQDLGHFTPGQTAPGDATGHPPPTPLLTPGPAGACVLTDLVCPTEASGPTRCVLLRQPLGAKAKGLPSRAHSSAVGGTVFSFCKR